MSELKPFVVAMVFGNPPNTVPAIVVNLAPNEISAAVMAVSKTYLDGQTQTIVGFNVAQLTEDFITAAHRGTAEPAPVLSIVPKPEGMRVDSPEYSAWLSEQEKASVPPDGAA